MIEFLNDPAQRTAVADAVLRALPEWFGLLESTAEYIRESAHMPFWADVQDSCTAGFIALKETSPHTAEIYVMGVKPEYHRQGVGRRLYAAFEAYARAAGYSYVQVKTVREGVYETYDRTNAFYRSLGFCELECFPTLWDENNPCQIYVKYIGSTAGKAEE